MGEKNEEKVIYLFDGIVFFGYIHGLSRTGSRNSST